jgi:hypothetical protein
MYDTVLYILYVPTYCTGILLAYSTVLSKQSPRDELHDSRTNLHQMNQNQRASRTSPKSQIGDSRRPAAVGAWTSHMVAVRIGWGRSQERVSLPIFTVQRPPPAFLCMEPEQLFLSSRRSSLHSSSLPCCLLSPARILRGTPCVFFC